MIFLSELTATPFSAQIPSSVNNYLTLIRQDSFRECPYYLSNLSHWEPISNKTLSELNTYRLEKENIILDLTRKKIKLTKKMETLTASISDLKKMISNQSAHHQIDQENMKTYLAAQEYFLQLRKKESDALNETFTSELDHLERIQAATCNILKKDAEQKPKWKLAITLGAAFGMGSLFAVIGSFLYMIYKKNRRRSFDQENIGFMPLDDLDTIRRERFYTLTYDVSE